MRGPGAEPGHDWRCFAADFATAAGLLCAAIFLFVLGLDPYGLRAGPGRARGPIMDINQRFMDPQIVRSGRYDSAVFGTSTVRLLDPVLLAEAFGGRFANLGLNAGTPWEQVQLAELFLRHVPRPQTLVWGIDTTWCDPDADAEPKRITSRAFPPWLYDDDPLDDLPHLLNLRSLSLAGRVLLHRLGFMRERVRGDGYDVFVPPEAHYDLARARWHLWHGGEPTVPPVEPPVRLIPEERAALRMPALAWLDDILGRVPHETTRILAFPPVHVAAQARPGSLEAERVAECKARVAAIGRGRGATVVDFQIPSSVTTDDANYWDGLHYRLPVAARLVLALKTAAETKADAPDGLFQVLTGPD
jgi:hypothetical protein